MRGSIMRFALPALAATSLLLGSGHAEAQSKVQAGVSAAVTGRVEVASLDTRVGRVAKSGEDIFLGDHISSAALSGMQVLLLDETVFTIGANSALTIDEFVYNPDTGGGKVAARVLKGAFRFVTGRIAQRRPQAMAVKLPVGSIGVRGTIAAGRVDGDNALVVLLGPGSNTDTEERIGRITVSNAGQSVDITRAGFATMIKGAGAAPIEPFQLPLADLRALTRSLAASSRQAAAGQETGGNQNSTSSQDTSQSDTDAKEAASESEESDGSDGQVADTDSGTGDLAGEDQAAARKNAVATLDAPNVRQEQDRLLEDAVQDQPENLLPDIADGTTSFDELRRIQTGTHNFVIDTAFVQDRINGLETNLPGNMKVTLEVDFGARTLGGGDSSIRLDTTAGGGNIDFNDSIRLNDYSRDGGLVKKTFGDDVGDSPLINGSTLELRNVDGIAAQRLRADMRYDDGQGNKGLGAGDSPSRVSN